VLFAALALSRADQSFAFAVAWACNWAIILARRSYAVRSSRCVGVSFMTGPCGPIVLPQSRRLATSLLRLYVIHSSRMRGSSGETCGGSRRRQRSPAAGPRRRKRCALARSAPPRVRRRRAEPAAPQGRVSADPADGDRQRDCFPRGAGLSARPAATTARSPRRSLLTSPIRSWRAHESERPENKQQ
jgi:hypothetical protein